MPVFLLFIEGKESIRTGRHVDLLSLERSIDRYYNMIYLDEWSDKMKICRDTKITSLLSIDDNLISKQKRDIAIICDIP